MYTNSNKTYQNLNISNTKSNAMSLLSASHYTSLSQAIALLKNQIDEQANQHLNHFELVALKLKMIEQQTEQLKRNAKRQQKQATSKIDHFATQVRSNLRAVLQSYPKNDGFEDIEIQLRELQNSKEKLVRWSEGLTKSTEQKLQSEIDDLQQRVEEQNQMHRQNIRQLQSQLKQEIQITRSRLKRNQQMLDSSTEVQEIERIYQQLEKELAEVRAKRIERKGNFLNLLQTIVVKFKQGKSSGS